MASGHTLDASEGSGPLEEGGDGEVRGWQRGQREGGRALTGPAGVRERRTQAQSERENASGCRKTETRRVGGISSDLLRCEYAR